MSIRFTSLPTRGRWDVGSRSVLSSDVCLCILQSSASLWDYQVLEICSYSFDKFLLQSFNSSLITFIGSTDPSILLALELLLATILSTSCSSTGACNGCPSVLEIVLCSMPVVYPK